MPNKTRQLAELAAKLGRDEKDILIEALETAGSIDGAALLLSEWLGERVWSNSVRNELQRFRLSFRREVVGRVEALSPHV